MNKYDRISAIIKQKDIETSINLENTIKPF